MTVFRVERHERDFFIIDNAAVRDERLSFRARGVLAFLLSLPPGATMTAEMLAQQAKEGRDAIRTACNELVEAGYLERRKYQTPNGQWVTETIVHERPDRALETGEPVEQALKEEGLDRRTTTYAPDGAESTLRLEVPEVPDNSPFSAFWESYPRRNGQRLGKQEAVAAWKRLKPAERVAAMEALPRYATSCERGENIACDAVRWLRHRRWEDWQVEQARLTRVVDPYGNEKWVEL